MDFLQAIFIAPISFLMQIVLEQSFNLIGEYGWAVVILSIVVNIVMIPLYKIAEKLAEKERNIQSILQPKIAQIKQNVKGEERFHQISALYKEYRYHPIHSLRSSLGFFIQVPFFIAAYLLLINYLPFNGISFGWITDISQPDQVFMIAGVPINMLPILMTVVNLGSIYFFKTATTSENIKLLALAFFFLVILYTAPAAAVLYWTVNNIWSFGRGGLKLCIKKYC